MKRVFSVVIVCLFFSSCGTGGYIALTLTYDPGSRTGGGTVPDSVLRVKNYDVFIFNPTDLYGREISGGIYQKFVGWSVVDDNSPDYYPGDTVTLRTDTTLYACYTSDLSVVGKRGPGGGFIYWQDANYLYEAAPDGWNDTSGDPATRFKESNITSATYTGEGFDNTASIVALNEDYKAAELCDSATVNSKSDWYLPSEEELKNMHLAINQFSDFEDHFYWSSTIDGNSNVIVYYFHGANSYRLELLPDQMSFIAHVRPIRRISR